MAGSFPTTGAVTAPSTQMNQFNAAGKARANAFTVPPGYINSGMTTNAFPQYMDPQRFPNAKKGDKWLGPDGQDYVYSGDPKNPWHDQGAIDNFRNTVVGAGIGIGINALGNAVGKAKGPDKWDTQGSAHARRRAEINEQTAARQNQYGQQQQQISNRDARVEGDKDAATRSAAQFQQNMAQQRGASGGGAAVLASMNTVDPTASYTEHRARADQAGQRAQSFFDSADANKQYAEQRREEADELTRITRDKTQMAAEGDMVVQGNVNMPGTGYAQTGQVLQEEPILQEPQPEPLAEHTQPVAQYTQQQSNDRVTNALRDWVVNQNGKQVHMSVADPERYNKVAQELFSIHQNGQWEQAAPGIGVRENLPTPIRPDATSGINTDTGQETRFGTDGNTISARGMQRNPMTGIYERLG